MSQLNLPTSLTIPIGEIVSLLASLIVTSISSISAGAISITSQIFNLECYTLDHHAYHILFCILVDPRNSTQLNDPRRELGISLFSYLSSLKF